jgi:hypothetical protein
MNKLNRALVIFGLLMLLRPPAFAETSLQSSSMSGFRKSFATVMFCGLGGAVLGLSTLSFYGKPDEHIGNISTGFAIGIIGGVAFAAVDTAQSVRRVESYGLHDNIRGKAIAKARTSDALLVPVFSAEF